MSLLDQSQQWLPTSVVVTVHQARNLRTKGKNGTNDAYAIIQVAKEKFSTSVSEKCVAPVWKEEASFDLPLFHPGNVERCTLYIVVMHRAQVGLDKFLGQAVVNLLEHHDDKSRKKTDWYKLVDKSGKEDKVRGEVLLDIKFMRNNMSVSMFDLSMQDKPRSRISKLKDKVRGKKNEGSSDSVSAIVPPVSQVLTDSEEEADAQSLNHSSGEKKKSKIKNIFASKSNLQRNMSQSMSTLGTLPEKNSSLSASRSSGLNVDSTEGKKKFRLLGHKRTGSSDSKVSLGAFSLLGRSKQSNSELNNLCINGSHVYTEEAEAKAGSTLSLNSSGLGSVEDVHKHTSDASADINKSVSVPLHNHESADKALLEQQRHQQEENRRQAEEKRIAEAKRMEEEEKYRAEAKRLQDEEQRRQQEEQERRRCYLEDEAKRKKQEEEERRNEEERMRLEAAESHRLEEERQKAEDRKRQEEASMTERLSTLFGMIKKKKDEVQQQSTGAENPAAAPHTDSRSPDIPISHHTTNPFDDIPRSDPPPASDQSLTDPLNFSRNPQTPSAMVFLNRTAKVSAVKPRLPQILEAEPADYQSHSQPCPSPAQSESTPSIVPSECPDTFSNLHSSLAPPNVSRSPSGSPRGSTEDLSLVGSEGSSATMADQRRRSPLPPLYSVHRTQPGESHVPVRDFKNPAYVEDDGSQQRQVSLPLPDYNMLFPQKRHGVQGQTQWDHLVSELSQKHRDSTPECMGPEMSVDGPVEQPNPRLHETQENPAIGKHQVTKPVSSKKVAAPAPPRHASSQVSPSVVVSSERQGQKITPHSLLRSSSPAVPSSVQTSTTSSGTSKDGGSKGLYSSAPAAPTTRPPSGLAADTTPLDEQRKPQVASNKEAPTAKPRQRVSGQEPANQEESAAKASIQTLSNSNMSGMKKRESFEQSNQFSSTEHLSQDSRAQLQHDQEVDIFSGNLQREQKSEKRAGMPENSDNTFNQEKTVDPFVHLNSNDSVKLSESRKKDEQSNLGSPAFQRRNSSRKKIVPSSVRSENIFLPQQEPGSKEDTASPTTNQVVSARRAANAFTPRQPESHLKQQSRLYGKEDPSPAEAFPATSAFPSPQHLSNLLEEPPTQAEHLSGGKSLLKAWVSPSEPHSASTQSNNGSGLGLSPRRPHPVKPMSSSESQPTSFPAVKEIKDWDSAPGKIKLEESVESGPYSQLTTEELVKLVVKQQMDLSKKDSKIKELEEYIDNLLVRVIEEKPAILQALNIAKPV
ncbi:rab11 family-interacting protein 1 isoform X2 [Girardinichthys multiradiatus]|uniref:rab11 family-interacting protein 1 isoform X2 n=1 Tax=Girardinichthys multiradiatus TaxID=208333 RepID=UPI001FAC4F7C|nr:rab11 family-interacting protein 1 isoform X2 [Girardinichthys multiradiatus]